LFRELAKNTYSRISDKRNASSEDQYKDLAAKFREMEGYKNTAELADECDKQFRLAKAERERREAEECERRRIEEEMRYADEMAKQREEVVKKRRETMIRCAVIFCGIIIFAIFSYIISPPSPNLQNPYLQNP